MPSPERWSFDLYSRGQQLVIGVLFIIVLGLTALIRWWPASSPAFEMRDDLLAYAQAINEAKQLGEEAISPGPAASFPFDPNTVTADELRQLGLTERQASSWLKYRGNRSNAFPTAESIRKLYVLDSAMADRLIPLVQMGDSAPNESIRSIDGKETDSTESFPFDPNTVTTAALERLGLSTRQARGFITYREKRNRPFTSASELDELRLLRPAQKERLKPLVDIDPAMIAQADNDQPKPSTYATTVSPATYSPTAELAPGSIDINGALAAEFELIRGVGPYWAGRFVKFREALGGFISVDQIRETYGLPDSLFAAMRPFLLYDRPVFRRLPLNSLSADELDNHPYIDRKLAGIIVRFREQHGAFRNREDLERIRILDAERIDRLMPYLDFAQK